MDDAKLRHIARTQEGLFTREQAMSCGYAAPHIAYRLRRGTWRKVVGPVLAAADVPLTPGLRDRAFLLAVPGAVLAGPAAARRWDIKVSDHRPCVAVPADRRPRRSEGLIIRETLPRQDLTIFAGVPVTSLARTVFDCVRLLPDDEALGLLDVALRREWISFGELCDRVRAHVGRPGARRLVSLVRQVGSGARSHAERLAVTLLRRSGIEGWTANAEIHDEGGLVGVGDLVFREERVVAEVDGWEFHSARDAFERDRARQNRLVAAGWTVLRFTWRDLVRDPDRVVNTIRSVLAARRRRRKA